MTNLGFSLAASHQKSLFYIVFQYATLPSYENLEK